MKKLFIAALIVAAAGTSAFAKDATKISDKARYSFEAQFAGASNVSWSANDNYFKAAFTVAEQKVEAFYDYEGQLIGTSRKVDFKTLPLNAIQKIQKKYSNSKVTETIEFEKEGDKNYYVSLNDGDKKQVLQVSMYGDVTRYSSSK